MNRNKYWRFRLYPENKSLYFLVWIFKSKKDMVSYIKRMKLQNEVRKTLRACVIHLNITKVNKNGRTRKHSLCGDILFWQKDLGVSVTSHEIAHAALVWVRRTKSFDDEERFCEVIGELNRQLVSKCYDLNIY